MIPYPRIDPVIVHVGPLAIRWYGLMYLLGFFASFFLVKKQIREELGHEGPEKIARELALLDGIIVVLVAGVIIGGRLGYVLFYNPSYFLHHPSEILATWHGGMSFHGGAAGVLLAGWLYCKRHGTDFFRWADRFCVTVPVGLGLGRIGNFINGELYGRPADVPWAMIFPSGGFVPRHPSQLYEAVLEGVLLFLVLWSVRKRPWPSGSKTALFFIGYGVIRFLVEFFREPDPQLGFVALGWVTMGQILSLVLVVFGVFLWIIRNKKGTKEQA
jgi:phosphatidylglycerol:prolipoprotein diacylglycerol transferase